MTKYLLDTNILSLYAKSDEIVVRKLNAVPANQLAMSSITLMELEFGIARNPQMSKAVVSRIRTLIREIQIIPYESLDALETVSVRVYLETNQIQKQAKPIGKLDSMIAATARARGLICVTRNTDEYSRVPNLQLEDWA
jgi:tRNA(fMet)-specific endonuclease VapC